MHISLGALMVGAIALVCLWQLYLERQRKLRVLDRGLASAIANGSMSLDEIAAHFMNDDAAERVVSRWLKYRWIEKIMRVSQAGKPETAYALTSKGAEKIKTFGFWPAGKVSQRDFN